MTELEKFLILNITFIALGMIEYLLVLQFPDYVVKKTCKRSATYHVNAVMAMNERNNNEITVAHDKSNNEKKSEIHLFDSVAKVALPIVYLICLIAYILSIAL